MPDMLSCTASAVFEREPSMQTQCVRHGQNEIGIIENEGREFSAFGATTIGRHVTGYTRLVNGKIQLSSWYGKATLASRSEVVERFWSGTLALMFRLPRGRFICGYSLGEDGMLFRGELLTGCDEEEARRHALMIAECFAELDAEVEEHFAAEQSEEQTPA
jgi:hypothetical protein